MESLLHTTANFVASLQELVASLQLQLERFQCKKNQKRHKNRYDKQSKHVHARWRSQTQPQRSTECHGMPRPHEEQPACLSAGNTPPPPLSPPPRTRWLELMLLEMPGAKQKIHLKYSSELMHHLDLKILKSLMIHSCHSPTEGCRVAANVIVSLAHFAK